MKALLILFTLISLNVSAQVQCSNLPEKYSGECETFDRRTKDFGTYTYKKGLKHGEFSEFYASKQLKAEGNYRSNQLHGDFSSYYESGNKFASGKFKQGSGAFTLYYQNGNRKVEGQFEDGVASGNWTIFDLHGKSRDVVEMDGERKDMFVTLTKPNEQVQTSPFESFSFGNFGMGDIDSMMNAMRAQMDQMMNRLQNGADGFSFQFGDSVHGNSFSFDTTFTWDSFGNFDQLFDSFSDTSFSKSFHFDTIIRSLSSDPSLYLGGRSADLVDFPDVEPSFIGGEDAMKQFILSEMRYPENDREIAVKGTVFVEAIIEKDGSISQPRIALGASDELDKEALRIVESMPNWSPAMKGGQAVRTRSIIAIPFEG
jgi:hypothetical protein